MHGYFCLGKTSGPPTKAVGKAVGQDYIRSEVSVSARRITSAMNRFFTKQTKMFEPKDFSYLKNPKKLFVAQKINLENTLIYGAGEDSIFPNP